MFPQSETDPELAGASFEEHGQHDKIRKNSSNDSTHVEKRDSEMEDVQNMDDIVHVSWEEVRRTYCIRSTED
jgi:hypothetical protein